MDNQHKLIKGYRELNEQEIALINEIKTVAEQVGALVAKVHDMNDFAYDHTVASLDAREHARVFIEDAKLRLQIGFMELTRAIAKSTTF